MMKLKVKNYRGIASAEIEIDRIAVICGPNGSGKSSIADGAAAVLTGNPVPELPPHTKLNKEDYKALVHDGQTGGSVILEDTDAGPAGVSLMMAFPDGKLQTIGGRGLQISPTAAGVRSAQLPNIRPADRAALLVSMLAAVPTKDDLAAHFKDAGIDNPAIATKVWEIVEARGWDGAHSQAVDTGKKLKGQWLEATGGDAWGIDKGEGYRPGGWRPVLDHVSAETAEKMLANLKESHAQVVGAAAVGEDKRRELQAIADTQPLREVAVTNAATARASAMRAVEGAKQAYRAEIAEMPPVAMKCPSCKAMLLLETDEKTNVISLARTEVGADPVAHANMLQRVMDKHKLPIETAEQALEAQQNAWQGAIEARNESVVAAQKVAGMKAAPAPTHEVNVRDSLESVQQAQVDFNLTSIVKRTADLHSKLRINHVIKEALAPAGLRAKAIADKLLAFNTEVDRLTDAMGAPQVTITPEMEITVGGRPYRDVSDSEQFRARVAIQVATALRQGTPFVIIDNDIDMDTRWYGGLLKMLLGAKVHAIVAFRANNIGLTINPQNPKSPKAIQDLVRSYWLDGGVAHQVKAPTAAAA